MTTSRLILQSAIVLIACVVGFVMGRTGATPPRAEAVGATRSDWPLLEPAWDLDISSSPGASFPEMSDPRVDSTSGFGRDTDQGPNRQFYPDAVHGDDGPRPFSRPLTAEPIRRAAQVATPAQLKALIRRELPDASESDKSVWAEELEGLSLDSAREVLMLRESLDSLQAPQTHDSVDSGDR